MRLALSLKEQLKTKVLWNVLNGTYYKSLTCALSQLEYLALLRQKVSVQIKVIKSINDLNTEHITYCFTIL